jgi:hypothetical protein
MRLALSLSVLAFASCSAVPTQNYPIPKGPDPAANHFTGSLVLAGRELDNDWKPVEEQYALGFEVSGRPGFSRFGWEMGISGSTEEDSVGNGVDQVDFTGSFYEFYAGARFWVLDPDARVQPYVGAGFSAINAKAEIDQGPAHAKDDDTSAAAYAHIGVLVPLGASFHVGVDARILFGSDIELEGFDTDADYQQLAFLLGWSW